MKKRHLAIAIILLLALGLRQHAISPYLFYPDSYQSLMVAYNLTQHFTAVGPLGPEGVYYPGYFHWTRPLYPALIALGNRLTDPVSAAQLINLLSGLGAVILAYLVTVRLIRSTVAGLIAALLLAVSFNHTVYGGFVMTETFGVFMLLLALWQLLRRRDAPATLADPQDFLTGTALSAATLVRYEYVVLLVPFLVYSAKPFSWARLANIVSVYCFALAAAITLVRPFPRGPAEAVGEAGTLVAVGALAAIIMTALILLRRRLAIVTPTLTKLTVIALWAFAALLVAQIFGLPILRETLAAPRVFFATDPLIGLLTLIGFTIMLRSRTQRGLATFLLVCGILLAGAYYSVNPAMQRYYTHLLPFIIVAAAVGGAKLIGYSRQQPRAKQALLLIVISCAFVYQAIATFMGMRYWHQGIWFREGYEYKAARLVRPKIPNHAIILAAQPEPYFFLTGHSTQSVTNFAPYIYMDNLPDDRTIAIVQDEGMEADFPRFSQILDHTMAPHLVYQTKVGEPYREKAEITPENKPLRLYILDLKTLRSYLKAETR